MKHIFLFTAIAVINGCSGKPDLEGSYSGIFPCADCEGIESTLFIDKAGVYKLNSKYIDKSDYIYQTSGIWFIRCNNQILELVDDEMQYYIINDDTLELLDSKGQRVELGEHYQINR